MTVLTPAQAKAYLRLESGTQDALLPDFIAAAVGYVEDRCGPLESLTVTRRLRPNGERLALPIGPGLSLTSVTPADGGAALDLDDLYLDSEAAVVTRNDGGCFTARYYDVVYIAGRDQIPGPLLTAVKEILRDTYRPLRGGRQRPGSASPEQVANTIPGSEYVAPIAAQRMMAPYERTL